MILQIRKTQQLFNFLSGRVKSLKKNTLFKICICNKEKLNTIEPVQSGTVKSGHP